MRKHCGKLKMETCFHQLWLTDSFLIMRLPANFSIKLVPIIWAPKNMFCIPKNSNLCSMWYNFSHLIASLGHDKIVASNCGSNPRMSSRREAARGGQFVWNVVAFLVKFVRNAVRVVVVVAVVVACWHMCPQMSRAIAPTVVASHIDSSKLRCIQHSALKCTSRGSRLRFQTCAQLVTDKYSLCPSVPPPVCLPVCLSVCLSKSVNTASRCLPDKRVDIRASWLIARAALKLDNTVDCCRWRSRL